MRTIPQILLSLPEKPDDGDNPLRLIVTLLSPEMHLRFEERFKVIGVPSYSLTEDILSVIGPRNMPKEKLGSCGVVLAPEVHRVAIHDEDCNPLLTGKAGEIVKQSRQMQVIKESTAKALKGAGSHRRPDLGADGYLYCRPGERHGAARR
jgi:hypothetical protein